MPPWVQGLAHFCHEDAALQSSQWLHTPSLLPRHPFLEGSLSSPPPRQGSPPPVFLCSHPPTCSLLYLIFVSHPWETFPQVLISGSSSLGSESPQQLPRGMPCPSCSPHCSSGSLWDGHPCCPSPARAAIALSLRVSPVQLCSRRLNKNRILPLLRLSGQQSLRQGLSADTLLGKHKLGQRMCRKRREARTEVKCQGIQMLWRHRLRDTSAHLATRPGRRLLWEVLRRSQQRDGAREIHQPSSPNSYRLGFTSWEVNLPESLGCITHSWAASSGMLSGGILPASRSGGQVNQNGARG